MAPSVEIPGYEIIRPIGSGGMSTVYLALQRSLDRKVAIKVMRRSGDHDDTRQLEKRFLLEGRMMAKLPHRNIVAVYDIVSNDAIAYIAMEYLSGGSLTERMRAGLSLADAVSVVVQIAGALDYAHANNVVHRDLKPANIMFRDNGTPVLTDFGIARYQDMAATKLTQTGMLVGTPTYMSPEQINAEKSDGRSDLYSLGILFYEMLTGTTPFKGDSPIAVLMAHLTQEAPPLPPEFASFQDIVDRMIAKKREDRFADMKEFSTTLKSRLVQSDTLQMRLQVDPNLSTSEQLRQLGFASTPGESLRAKLPLPPKDKTRDGRRTPAPAPANKAAAAAPPPRAGPNRLFIAIGAVAAALVLAAVIWLVVAQRGRLSRDEQDYVALLLRTANQYVADNKLVEPADENAFAYVQKVLQKDPQNDQAQALLETIAKKFAAQADAALAAGKLDQALDAAKQGLLVRPDDAALAAAKAKIEQAQKARQVEQEVDALLARAQKAEADKHIVGEGGAYALLGQARTLAPENATVNQRIAALVDDQLAAPRKALQQGQLATAQADTARLQAYFADEKAFVEFKSQLDGEQKKQQSEKQIAGLLERGNRELREGHLDEPAGGNAYATYGELAKLDGGDKRVADFGAGLARAFFDDARKLEAKSPERALDRVTTALQLAPQLADAQQFKARIEQRLGQRATQVAQQLGAIRQAIAEQRFVPPAPNDAHSALAALLRLDPENKEARQTQAELPKRIADAVATRAASDLAAATTLLKSAQQVYPQDPALAPLAARLDAQAANERQATQAQNARALVAKTIAARLRTLDDWRKAGQALATLAGAEGADKDKEFATLRNDYVAAFGNELRAAANAAEFDALAKLFGEQDRILRGAPEYAALRQSETDLRAKVVAAEQARLAEQTGTLVLNAFPWGTVESILDANRQPVALPASATTPVVMTLPAGNYVVTFRHPAVAKAAQVIARVEAKKRASANATFPTLTAQDYFTRAGW